MNRKQAKKYILTNWKVSNGKRITKMLNSYKKYMFPKKDKNDKIVEYAKELFKTELAQE